jgi:predicted nucleic acid-binding protein
MRVLLDTNVLVRAAKGLAGPPGALLALLRVEPHILIASPFLLTELDRACITRACGLNTASAKRR